MNITELPKEIFAAIRKKPREPFADLQIGLSERKFLKLFKKIKDFRGRLPTSFQRINDFKVYFFSIQMSLPELIQLSTLVFMFFHKKESSIKEGAH